MIAFEPGMGGGSREEPGHNLRKSEIESYLERQQFYDVTEVVADIGLTGLILEAVIPPESPLSLRATFNPESFTVLLDIAPPPGREIFNCVEFSIEVHLFDDPVGVCAVSLEKGKFGPGSMRPEEAVRFQGVLEAASKISV